MASVAELRQILKEDSSGKNLYDHLTETLMKILLDRPANAYDSFELISSQVKENPLDPNPLKGRDVPASKEELSQQTLWYTKNSLLLKVPEEPTPDDDGAVKYPDLVNDASLYEWAGISFGKGDVYRLYLSIKAFALTLPSEVEKIRFFGKVYTRSTPYFVIEGLTSDDFISSDQEKAEAAGDISFEGKEGLNKFTYWVSTSVNSEWSQLPNITPQQVVIARQIKRLLTGDLNASVPSYPPFPGNEGHLLRVQLALISSTTSISPDGFYELDEDSDPPVLQPVATEALVESFPKSSYDLTTADSWRHHEVEINKIGRVTALPEQLDENGDPIEVEEVVVFTSLEALKPEDWSFRVAPGGAGQANGSCVVARSLVWPGAVAISSGRQYSNIYVGYAISYNKAGISYSPPLPQPIQEEYKGIYIPIPGSSGEDEEPLATENDDGILMLVEEQDPKVDPTPPIPEGEEEDGEDDEED